MNKNILREKTSILFTFLILASCTTTQVSKLGSPELNPTITAIIPTSNTSKVFPNASPSPKKSESTSVAIALDQTGDFLYPSERISVQKSNVSILQNDTGLPANPPVDLNCGYQELAKNSTVFKHTFKEAFEASRDTYSLRINKDIAKIKNDHSEDPSYDFQLKYSINRLEDPKPGIKVWQIIFFSDFSTTHNARGKTLYIGHARITQSKPCLYSGGASYSYFYEDNINYPFKKDSEYTFDYTQ